MGDIKEGRQAFPKKEIELEKKDPNKIQIHFGNIEVLKVKLLESINKNLIDLNHKLSEKK